MNPLSALRPAISPEFNAALSAKPGPVGGAIPAVELEKLAEQSGAGANSTASTTGGSFANYLGQLVREVNAQQGAADGAVNGLMTGQDVSLHQAMLSMEEASVSFQLMVEVRNRLLDSYQELMRMQI